YIGTRLIEALLRRGHTVRALARASSVQRVPSGAQAVEGDALDAASIGAVLRDGETIVHLVGTPHPNPSKAQEFENIDLASIRATVSAARQRNIPHLVYVSVAQPAPAMHAYVAARAAGESAIGDAGLTATFLRPWYVLGPGHWWPIVLIPGYAIAELLPPTRAMARRIGLVTVKQMVDALVRAVETPPARGTRRIVDVPAMRSGSFST
ncbi:MAG TPA: NAD(P)H-binding protein, partial [Casimicrobiaceae bacterium]|nr:NAD(P)H-binding protein [Casimicrobiaceae bacterium]